MIRVTYYLPEQHIAKLRRESQRTGLPMSEILRRFIDQGLPDAPLGEPPEAPQPTPRGRRPGYQA